MKPSGRFAVAGTRIAKVTFSVDGHTTRVVWKADAQGRFAYALRRKLTVDGVHRVTARVTYLPGSTLRTKTLQMTFAKCKRKAKAPAFTG